MAERARGRVVLLTEVVALVAIVMASVGRVQAWVDANLAREAMPVAAHQPPAAPTAHTGPCSH